MSVYSPLITFILLFVALAHCQAAANPRHNVRKFPKGFRFGTATAAYQVEGAWNEDGKSDNIWDTLTHKVPSPVEDGSSGDIADDSYHQYKRDVQMMRELGLDFYRFSLSWSRLLPTSFPDHINEAAVQYYNNLIDEMLKYNIEPMITLYHWDLPQKLQDMGGWANPHIVDWFGDYARVAYNLFGDRVKMWMTINEPHVICHLGYGNNYAPALELSGIADYMCNKYLLLAHAKAYHIYDEDFRSTQGGSVFIVFSAQWHEPETENDTKAAEDSNFMEWGNYVYPIFSETGDFPPVMKERIAAKSAEQGYARSRLPELSDEEVKYILGTSDYFGLNHYSTYLIYRNSTVDGYYAVPSLQDDLGVMMYQKPEWSTSIDGPTTMVKSVPRGFYTLLTYIRKTYNNPKIIITENGFATHGGLDDYDRVDYYRQYLNAMLDAIDEGSDIVAYTAWSLMDNFEWVRGYTQRFGLYEVDYDSPARTRTPRKSAFVYKEIIRSHELDFHYEPKTTKMSIDKGH